MQLGRYELVAKLGEGGTSEVHLARVRGAERVQKLVVVKRLRPERAADPEARARFAEEARIAVSLAHPHIVPVFELGETDGELYLVMEWVRGGPLGAIAGPGRAPLEWSAVALVGAGLCDGLAAVHGRRARGGGALVHGDVTPANILLTDEGHPLLADFGMARFAARGRGGTRRYLAPEQARGERFDGRADLYALALVLLEAATGQAAYDGPDEEIARQTRVGVVARVDGVQAGLAAVLKRALAPAPAARYPTAAEMGRALEALLDAEPGARAEGRRLLAARIAAARAARPDPAAAALAATATATATATVTRTRMTDDRPEPTPRTRRGPLVVALIAGGAALVAIGVAIPTFLSRARAVAPTPPVAASPPPVATAVPVAAPQVPVAVEPPPLVPPSPQPPVTVATPAPRPPAPPRDRAPHAAVDQRAPAHLDLNAVPWAVVRIDGTPRGETPLLGVALAPGRHTVELENEPLGVRRRLVLDLAPGEHLRRVEELAPAE